MEEPKRLPPEMIEGIIIAKNMDLIWSAMGIAPLNVHEIFTPVNVEKQYGNQNSEPRAPKAD